MAEPFEAVDASEPAARDAASTVGVNTAAFQTGADYPVMDDATSERLAHDAEEKERFYRDQLAPNWQDAVKDEKLYHGHKEEWRKEHEKWRTHLASSRPFVVVESKAAQMVEILTGSDPIIQANAVGDDDRERAKEAEALLEQTLDGNDFRKQLATISRAISVVGTDWITSRYGRQAFTVNTTWTPKDREYFNKTVEEVVQNAGPGAAPPDWQTDPENFEKWRHDVNLTYHGQVPEPPLDGPREIVRYEGPIIERVPYFEMRFDPLVQERKNQTCIMRRMVRNEQWVKKLVEKGIFVAERVEKAMKGWDGERLDQYEQEVAQVLGYTVGDRRDPAYKTAHEVWIVYDLENEEWPYQVILNRSQVVNVRPDQMPYNHGECEYLPIRNILVPNYLAGLGDLKQARDLFHELNTLRNHRMDGVKLSVMPVMAKSPEAGMSELQRHISPGMMMNIRRPQDIKKLIDSMVPDEAWREDDRITNEIDEVTGINGQVRGASATVNRVSASESQGRFQQALLRIKMSAAQVEDDLNPAVVHWLSHWMQFGRPELQVKVTGRGTSQLSTIRKQDLLDAFHYDLRFRGATRALNREMTVQQLTAFIKEFGQNLAPIEVRTAMKTAWETMGLKGSVEIINPKYTMALQTQWEQQMMMAQQAAAQQAAGGQAAAEGAPATVDPKAASALGGGQQ
jgi:hypothetical protein